MRPLIALTSSLTAAAIIAAVGCGGGDSPPGPTSSVLTTVEITPKTATLFTVAPGNTVTLSVVAKDQDGHAMAGLGSPSFSSANGAIADVTADGATTAVGAGIAVITASLTAAGVTRTGSTTVTVQVAPTTAAVTAPQFVFQPVAADVSAGGTVTWTFGSIHHDVTFTSAGAPADVPELQDGSAARTFPNHGAYDFRCSIHPQMVGSVRVH